MTARPGGSRPVAGRPWAAEALCARDTRFTDGPFGVERDAFLYARQLAHCCRAHCPAVADCANGLTAPGATRPREAVQAGIYIPPDYRQLPRVLPDSGCGPHCAGLPVVHREAVKV